jgi:hypothetical protein
MYRNSLKLLGGAVALAMVATNASAVTTIDGNGTIFLNVNDLTTNSSFVFDTGINVASFTGASSIAPIDVTGANWSSFLASKTSASDIVEYSVVGGSSGTSPKETVVFTGTSATQAQPGASVDAAYGALGGLLGQINGGAGINGSTFVSASSPPGGGWATGGYEIVLNNNAVVSDAQSLGQSLGFYKLTTSNPKSTTIIGGYQAFAGSWNLSTAGILSYTVSQVPLPAPLLLLLSGLGLMGVISRRGKSAGEVHFDGAAAV